MQLVTLGDSLTGFTDQTRVAWPPFLTLPLAHNAGVDGNTTAMMMARLTTDVLAYNPTDVTILAGTNDLAQGVALATILANIAAMTDSIRATGAKVWLLTVPPSTMAPLANTLALNAALVGLATAHGATLIDIWPLLAEPNGTYHPGWSNDGIHFNSLSAPVVAFAVQQVLRPSDFRISFPASGAPGSWIVFAQANPGYAAFDLVVDFAMFVTDANPNNAANYWNPYIAFMGPGTASIDIAGCSTSLDPVGTYQPHIVPVGQLLSRTTPLLGLIAWEVGLPGSLRYGATLYCRRA